MRILRPFLAGLGLAFSLVTANAAGPVNVNAADSEALQALNGVGPATAAAIIEEREANGPFATVDELVRVDGIGETTVERLRDAVVVE